MNQHRLDKILAKLEATRGQDQGSLVDALKDIFTTLDIEFLPDQEDADKLQADFTAAVEHALATSLEGSLTFVAPITPTAMGVAKDLLESKGDVLCWYAMNARDYADIRKFGRSAMEVENSAMFLRVGRMGWIWGKPIMISKAIPTGTMFVIGFARTYRVTVLRGCP